MNHRDRELIAKSGFTVEQVTTAVHALTNSEKEAADMTHLSHAEYALEILKERRHASARRAGEKELENRLYQERHRLREVGS